jgi:hypothetical protein
MQGLIIMSHMSRRVPIVCAALLAGLLLASASSFEPFALETKDPVPLA